MSPDGRDTVIGNMHKNLGEVQPWDFRVTRADKTDRHTYRNTLHHAIFKTQ